jgi:hypothetical protein
MTKLMGDLHITAKPGSEGSRPHFEVVFKPYVGRLHTLPAKANNYDELVALLMNLKFSEDDATRWAGKARSQGIVLINSCERTDSLLRDNGLLA